VSLSPHWFDLGGVEDQSGWKLLLRRIGIIGPFSECSTLRSIRCLESGGATLIYSQGNEPKYSLKKLEGGVATLVVRPPAIALPCIKKMYYKDCVQVQTHGERNVVVIRDKFKPINIALAGSDKPWLILGFSVSKLLENVGDGEGLHGLGIVAGILKWFINQRADPSGVRINIWPGGYGVTLFSFDVEESIPQRSVGKTLFSIPFGKMDLVKLSLLRTWRPIRGKRCIYTSPVIFDGNKYIKHRRWTVDLRRGKRGGVALNSWTPQIQLAVGISRLQNLPPFDYSDFRKICRDMFPNATLYICGGSESCYSHSDLSVGFHGTKHKHFDSLGRKTLARQLSKGASLLGDQDCRSIRAPGLNWSTEYLKTIVRNGFTSDSSLRDLVQSYPLIPWKTKSGMWLLPVHGPITRTGVTQEILQHANSVGEYICLYAHDHDPGDVDGRTFLVQQLSQLEDNKFPTRSSDWCERILNLSDIEIIDSIQCLSSGTWSVRVTCSNNKDVYQLTNGVHLKTKNNLKIIDA